MMPQENGIIVSAIEPIKNRRRIWMKKGKNLYNPETMPLMNGLWYGASSIVTNNAGWYVVVPITSGQTYTVSKKNDKTVLSYLSFALATTQELPEDGATIINSKTTIGQLKQASIEASSNANFLIVFLAGAITFTDDDKIKAIEELQVEVGTSKTSYEEYIDPEVFIKNTNGDYEEFLTKDIFYQRDLSSMKSSIVTNVTRAIEMVYGRVHFLNIAVSVNAATDAPSTILETDIIPKFVTELYASNGSRTYRCILNTDGKIELTNPNITGPTFLMITGVFML